MPAGVPLGRSVSAPVRPLGFGTLAGLAGVLLVGAALLLPRLGSQSLWLDEGLTVGPAVDATSVRDLIARTRAVDTQPPASHFLLWVLGAWMPRTEFFFRLPSFLAVELGIAMLYVLVRRLWGPPVALLVAGCAQLSPYLCFYAAEARNYGPWFLMITLSYLAVVRWWEAVRGDDSRAAWRWALALGAVNALGLWTHLFHVFVVIAEAAILGAWIAFPIATLRERWSTLASLAAAHVLTAVLFAPWLLVLVGSAASGTAGVPWTRPFTLGNFGYYLFAAHFGVSLGPDLRSLHALPMSAVLAAHPLALALAAIAMGITALTHARLVLDAWCAPERRWELIPLVAWPLVSLAGPLAYGVARSFPLHPRHLLFAWPLLPIVLALGVTRYPRLRPFIFASLALQVLALGNLLYDGHYAKDDERGAVHFAEAHSGAVAYVLGDVAPLYARRAEGHEKTFGAFRADTDDVWLIDNSAWEAQNQRARRRLALAMRAMHMRYDGGTTRFRGIVLRHWTARRS